MAAFFVVSNNYFAKVVNLWYHRAEYDPSTDLLQPEFTLKGRRYKREDLQVLSISLVRFYSSVYGVLRT